MVSTGESRSLSGRTTKSRIAICSRVGKTCRCNVASSGSAPLRTALPCLTGLCVARVEVARRRLSDEGSYRPNWSMMQSEMDYFKEKACVVR